MYDALSLGERESWEEVVWVIYKILQWADKFCEGTIYQCEWNKFFLQKVLPRGFLLYAEREKRGEKKRGEVGKCTILTSPSYGCG